MVLLNLFRQQDVFTLQTASSGGGALFIKVQNVNGIADHEQIEQTKM